MIDHEHRAGWRRSAGLMGSPVITMFWLLVITSALMIFFASQDRWGLFLLMLFVWFVGLIASLIDYRRDLTRKTFMRLSDPRFRVTADRTDTFYLTCGTCGHDWDSPGPLVRQYRSLLAPEATRRGMGASLPNEQILAIAGVRCPACGATDPGVLVAGR